MGIFVAAEGVDKKAAKVSEAFVREWIDLQWPWDPFRWKVLGNRVHFVVGEMVERRNGYEVPLTILPLDPDAIKGNEALYEEPSNVLHAYDERGNYNYMEAIPQDDRMMYRGMVWEEWTVSQDQGHICTAGTMNLGEEQKGLTFWSPEAGVAAHYANGFAPWRYKPGKHVPGVVVATWRSYGLTHRDIPSAILQSELAIDVPLPLGELTGIWLLRPVAISFTKRDDDFVRRNYYGEWNSSVDPPRPQVVVTTV